METSLRKRVLYWCSFYEPVKGLWHTKRFTSCRVTPSYLNKRMQRVNVNNKLSVQEDIYHSVRQCSILDSLLSNIFTSDMFIFLTTFGICKYTDDNDFYQLPIEKSSINSSIIGKFNHCLFIQIFSSIRCHRKDNKLQEMSL